MTIIDKAKQKINDLLPSRYTRKQSYNSNHTDNIGGTGSDSYRYIRLANRKTRNLTYKQYQEILKDTQVRVGWAILKYFLISKNYNLTSNSDDPLDIEITEFVQDCFDNMNISFRDVVKNILTAVPYGYSVQEKVYTVRDGRIVIDSIYPVHRRTIDKNPFVKDNKGELTAIHQETDYGNVNNYNESELRAYLNNEFYFRAFSLNSSFVQTTLVDNSAATTDSLTNTSASSNTNDKVFLPSYQDYLNPNYGFSSDPEEKTTSHYSYTTEYARARGASYDSYDGFEYSGRYWTRSPLTECDSEVFCICDDGRMAFDDIDASNGVRPSITFAF